MDSHGPSASPHRDGRLVVCCLGSDTVQTANRSIKDASRQVVTAKHAATPARITEMVSVQDRETKALHLLLVHRLDYRPQGAAAVDAATPARITEMVSVQDRETKALHLLLVHRLDYRPQGAAAVGDVVVFSEPTYAVFRTERLQMATPAYYRGQEGLRPGIRDVRDGTLTKDSNRWAKRVVPAGMVTSSSVSFASLREPWVYCASHYQLDRELRRLKDHFDEKYGYTAAARIRDPNAFAMWLGINFALNLNKTTAVRLGALDKFCYAHSSHNTVVHVYHGPVHYEDNSGCIATQEDWFDPHAGPRAWFTKKMCFTSQCEYRFAVSTLGDPVQPRHYIDVSPELRELTSAL